jgi:hypothetical protein
MIWIKIRLEVLLGLIAAYIEDQVMRDTTVVTTEVRRNHPVVVTHFNKVTLYTQGDVEHFVVVGPAFDNELLRNAAWMASHCQDMMKKRDAITPAVFGSYPTHYSSRQVPGISDKPILTERERKGLVMTIEGYHEEGMLPCMEDAYEEAVGEVEALLEEGLIAPRRWETWHTHV